VGCSVRVPSSSTTLVTAPASTTETDSAATSSPETATAATSNANAQGTFAIIGDFGAGNEAELAVANLVASHHPDFVITAGDNCYTTAGGIGTGRYDQSAGAYYSGWMKDISTTGFRNPVGTAAINGFFPSLGNHDCEDTLTGAEDYLAYFDLPGSGIANSSGNERYYDFVRGPVHFFALNSNPEEPDGTSGTSVQARWLQRQLAASTSTWNIVYFHHAPYSSDTYHGSTPQMRWPFAAWGADGVISGHAHVYERIMRDGIVYFVNGLGGGDIYNFGNPVSGSVARYNSGWGAQIVTATDATLDFEFFGTGGELVDSWRLWATPAPSN